MAVAMAEVHVSAQTFGCSPFTFERKEKKNSTSKGQIEASKPLLPDMDKLFLVDQLEKNMAKAARAAGLQAVWLGQQGRLVVKLHRHHWQVPATLLDHPLLGPNAEVDQPQLNS